MSFLTILKKIGKGIAKPFVVAYHWLTPENVKPIEDLIDHYANLAIPVVEKLAKLTPTEVDDKVVAALKKTQLTIDDVLGSKLIEALHDGARLSLAVELFRQNLVEIIETQGKVNLGDMVLTDASQVAGLDKATLRAGIDKAYAFYKKLSGKK